MSLQNINTYTYSPGFQIGQYHNAVLCISGNVQNLYLDGTLIATKTETANVLSNYSTTIDTTDYDNGTTTTDTYLIGNGALQLTNSNTAGSIKSYVTSSSGFSTSATNGLSVSLWFKASGVSSTRMRLFDLCTSIGSQGISVDISGTNQILAGYYLMQ